MSMSTSMYAVLAPTDDYRAAFRAWYACRDAGVDPPGEILKRLGLEEGETTEPNESGALVCLSWGKSQKVREVQTECGSGLEVALSDLPKGTTHVRCVTSW